MRRITFYLAVALMAFGIGATIVINLSQKTKNVSSKIETENTFKIINNNSSEQRKTRQPEFVMFKLKDLPCEDETLQIVWRELSNETAEINTERAENFKRCEDFLEAADFFQTDEQLDLNNDGVEEIFIRGIGNPFSRCGNNCYTYWIFQKTDGKDYKKLFEAEGYLPVVKNNKTLGYEDILFMIYNREFGSGNILYQFNGTKYVPRRCWSESLLYKGKGGEMVLGKKFNTEYYKCEESGFITNYRNRIDSQ